MTASRVWWRADMICLAVVTISFWSITLAWQQADVDAMLTSWVKSEADAWIFALTIAPLYFLLKWIAASWGAIVGIPTCLLAIHLILYRLRVRPRWLVAGGVTALIFIGIPFALNHREQERLTSYYQRSGAVGLPNLEGRALELPRSFSISKWNPSPRCYDECLDLLMFGRARSVTLTVPRQVKSPEAGAVAWTYRLGPSGKDCAGEIFLDVCPHLTTEALPRDRLILYVRPVESRSPETAGVVARRLYARDTRRPGAPPAEITRFLFPGYPGLLNIAWKDGGFHLPRTGTPILGVQKLDDELYRAAAPNRYFRGKHYPFR
ncbi:MAG TPA: hypothetical protein VK472_01745 [Allosphingosinicella sp.]|nr:hypothetical protein [Allosphingosinicella sp.]